MNIAANQRRIFLGLLAQLRPWWRRDPALPARMQSLFAAHRQFGSRDRRLYRELLYTTLRYLPWIEPLLDSQPDEAVRRVSWLATETPATHAFRAAYATGPVPAGDTMELIPAWFRAHCPEMFSPVELEVQLRRAPLWLRLQTGAAGQARIFQEFDARGWSWRRAPGLTGAVEVRSEADVTQTDAWRSGLFEVQDLGSQLVLATAGVQPGGAWLDACAGAGGKTLQLGRLVGPSGTVDAFDIRPAALEELERRVRRAPSSAGCETAGEHSADIRVLPATPGAYYDGVLIDAPCSGSGTWRRAPHLKWITTPEQIDRAAEKQHALLAQFSQRVRPGGRLVYATCSLSSRENEDVVTTFLSRHPDFAPEPFANTFGAMPRGAGLLILPSVHDTDGFFVASLQRR
jgi:16S rRNA (cytosine967-C5)-methyltransferase